MDQTSEDIWQTAFRAYMLIRVNESSDKVSVAKAIFALNEELDRSSAFITRASVVGDVYDIVVPIYARSLDHLQELADLILKQAGVDSLSSKSLFIDTQLEPADAHTPWPPHLAWGYIPRDEANPVNPGPTGFTPWG